MKKCELCEGKGYQTVLMQVGYPWDMPIKKVVGGKIFAKFCTCPKGYKYFKRWSRTGKVFKV
jgi:hypothetical protein